MRCSGFVMAALFGLIAVPALAQTQPLAGTATGARPGNEIGTGNSLPRSNNASNIVSGDTHDVIAPTLPSPPVGENGMVRDYLVSARSALAAGRTGEAQQALEMAETRALDRSVPQAQVDQRSDSAVVAQITNALHALGNGNRIEALRIIDGALAL